MRGCVAGLIFFVALVIACAAQAPAEDIIVGGISQQFVTPRDDYNTERAFAGLIRPHFYATSDDGDLLDVQDQPGLVVEHDGKAKIRLAGDGEDRFLDLLAMEPGLIGEHPVHKILRLEAMGVNVDDGLKSELQAEQFPDELFHTISFEYLPGKQATGVIAEVFVDGTFLVIPFETPLDWQSTQENISAPTHLHVTPRALSVSESTLAKEYETKILALPTFDEKRYPPPEIAKMECDLYGESLQNAAYLNVLDSIGFRFNAEHVIGSLESEPQSFGEELWATIWRGSGEAISYFGFEQFWLADRLRGLGAGWLVDCDTASGLRSYAREDRDGSDYFMTLRRSLEPDKTQRYKIVSVNDDGSSNVIYEAPGIMIMARPLPSSSVYWMISSEGWKAPDDTGPADPRWQSVYVVNTRNPDEYEIAQYPVPSFPNPPEKGTLYGGSDRLSPDGKYLYNTLYGYTDEGGGLWLADLSHEEFYKDPKSFARLLAWDHSLSAFALRNETNGDSSYTSLFVTGKEVREDFAMTANILRIKNDGLDSTVERKQRLLQMVGWNPVPFTMQTLSESEFRVGVETHFNYESSLLPRARGAYFVNVDTSE